MEKADIRKSIHRLIAHADEKFFKNVTFRGTGIFEI